MHYKSLDLKRKKSLFLKDLLSCILCSNKVTPDISYEMQFCLEIIFTKSFCH